jgi:DNA topoisomerase I
VAATAPRISEQKKTVANLEVVVDSEAAAEEAGLRYVTDRNTGYARKQRGDDCEYFDADGEKITDEKRLMRIRRLAIPPAWDRVWICASPNGHLQATGYDARRRKQYRYHERWREVRDEAKYEKMVLFGQALPKIRKRTEKDLSLPGLPREKVLATIVELLERTFIRVGNEEYAKENKSFGLTTLRNRHVDVEGITVHFQFRGKSGVKQEKEFTDRRVAKIIRKLQDLPGQELFQYLDDADERRSVTSQDVNDYLKEITGDDYSAKDFRTWAGTVLASLALKTQQGFTTKKEAKAKVKDAISAVAHMLGNTPAVCRKCYIHPIVLESYLDGTLIEALKQKTEDTLLEKIDDLREEEIAVLKFLRNRLQKNAESRA